MVAEAGKKVRLDDKQRELLEWLAAPMEGEAGATRAQYQWNTWALPTELARHELPGLKRRGLVDAEGRGNARQWWITDEGKEAIAK